MVIKDSDGNDFEIIHCTRCDAQNIDIIDLDEYNQILIFKCSECGEEFTKPVEIFVSQPYTT